MQVVAGQQPGSASRPILRWQHWPPVEDPPLHGAALDAFRTPSLCTHTRVVRRAHVFHVSDEKEVNRMGKDGKGLSGGRSGVSCRIPL